MDSLISIIIDLRKQKLLTHEKTAQRLFREAFYTLLYYNLFAKGVINLALPKLQNQLRNTTKQRQVLCRKQEGNDLCTAQSPHQAVGHCSAARPQLSFCSWPAACKLLPRQAACYWPPWSLPGTTTPLFLHQAGGWADHPPALPTTGPHSRVARRRMATEGSHHPSGPATDNTDWGHLLNHSPRAGLCLLHSTQAPEKPCYQINF